MKWRISSPSRAQPGGAVGQVALVLLLADRQAEVGALVAAVDALAALGREQGDDVVAGRERVDAGADRLDHAGALVAEHGRRVAGGVDARGRVEVGVADAAGDQPHQHLALLRARSARPPGRPAARRTPPAPPRASSSRKPPSLAYGDRRSAPPPMPPDRRQSARAVSSVGRALALHARGRRFEPGTAHLRASARFQQQRRDRARGRPRSACGRDPRGPRSERRAASAPAAAARPGRPRSPRRPSSAP